MKVTLSETGGLMPIRRAPLTLSTETLDSAAAAQLERLIEHAAAQAPPQARGGGAPDGMTYTVTVEGGSAPRVLRQSDAAMSSAFADLLGWLKRQAPR